jgi:hypothetical protein
MSVSIGYAVGHSCQQFEFACVGNMAVSPHKAVSRYVQDISGREAPAGCMDLGLFWICNVDLPTGGLHWWSRWQGEFCLEKTSLVWIRTSELMV